MFLYLMQYFFKHFIWHIPDGFATLLGGFFVLVAAVIAYVSVDLQIRTQIKTEDRRFHRDRDSLKFALYSELMMYVQPFAHFYSVINANCPPLGSNTPVQIPPFAEPIVFKSLIDKIGIVGNTQAIMNILTFHMNLINWPENFKKNDYYVVPSYAALALRLMAINLQEALTLLGPMKNLPLPPEMPPESYVYFEGRRIDQLSNRPASIQELLRDLAGGRPTK